MRHFLNLTVPHGLVLAQCPECFALVWPGNAGEHEEWHRNETELCVHRAQHDGWSGL